MTDPNYIEFSVTTYDGSEYECIMEVPAMSVRDANGNNLVTWDINGDVYLEPNYQFVPVGEPDPDIAVQSITVIPPSNAPDVYVGEWFDPT